MTKKKFAFIAPAALAGAAIAGVVTGAAGTIGRKVVEDSWSDKEEPKAVETSEHVYQLDVGNMTKHELVLALREIQEAWEDAHPKKEEPPHSPFYQG